VPLLSPLDVGGGPPRLRGRAFRTMKLPRLYELRFRPNERERRDRLWRVLCRTFFQRYIRDSDTVLDLGAGYCEFINHVVCGRRIALDVRDDVRLHADPGVEVISGTSTDLSALPNGSIDVAFASNFFEHLPSKQDLLRTLVEVRRVLRAGGRLLILQPNIRYTGGAYWDFFDHHLPLTERSLVEALGLAGLTPVEVRARFLPFTTKSALPQHPALVWLYLKIPIVHRLLGQQSWIVAVSQSTSS
jgi:SAM-dependent methyltransferase